MTAFYVLFEGIDGSGKTTQAELLFKNLHDAFPDKKILRTREPTGGLIGTRIREKAKDGSFRTRNEELSAFLGDRFLHVNETLRPALEGMDLIIQDRGYLSSAAYQGENIDEALKIVEMQNWVPEPDLVIFLDVPVLASLSRIRESGREFDEFEKADELERVRENYLSLLEDLPSHNRLIVNWPAGVFMVAGVIANTVYDHLKW